MNIQKDNTFQHISMATLLENSQVYENLPLPIQEWLQKSIQNSLKSQTVFLILYAICYILIQNLGGFITLYSIADSCRESSLFFVPYSGMIASVLLNIGISIAPYIVLIVGLCFIALNVVVGISKGFSNPLREELHWLAVISTIATVTSMIGISVWFFLISLPILLNIIVFLLTVTVTLWIIASFEFP